MMLESSEARDRRESTRTAELALCLKILGESESEAGGDAKSADWKVAAAAWMKKTRLRRKG